ncbi:uncharacterized protein N7484_001814 [Penicillium longicatenatum]|uniref:uncharacterized protein n=1 Tax=Penicillium longicatenatum TaxID=1561947 RepID=UPI0025474823|nr:uncharacterized protein N7484_001814 [Penicillium longicatenatum]KAJ5658165.1 hypothetical protein N7484_001814 [Penicillium longicatenatum]
MGPEGRHGPRQKGEEASVEVTDPTAFSVQSKRETSPYGPLISFSRQHAIPSNKVPALRAGI